MPAGGTSHVRGERIYLQGGPVTGDQSGEGREYQPPRPAKPRPLPAPLPQPSGGGWQTPFFKGGPEGVKRGSGGGGRGHPRPHIRRLATRRPGGRK
eukprot:1195894-Prorocentrum_minimum.AAC.5